MSSSLINSVFSAQTSTVFSTSTIPSFTIHNGALNYPLVPQTIAAFLTTTDIMKLNVNLSFTSVHKRTQLVLCRSLDNGRKTSQCQFDLLGKLLKKLYSVHQTITAFQKIKGQRSRTSKKENNLIEEICACVMAHEARSSLIHTLNELNKCIVPLRKSLKERDFRLLKTILNVTEAIRFLPEKTLHMLQSTNSLNISLLDSERRLWLQSIKASHQNMKTPELEKGSSATKDDEYDANADKNTLASFMLKDIKSIGSDESDDDLEGHEDSTIGGSPKASKANSVTNGEADILFSDTVSISSNYLPNSDSKSGLQTFYTNRFIQFSMEHIDYYGGMEMGSLEIVFDPSDKLLMIDEDEENESEDNNSVDQSQEIFGVPLTRQKTSKKKLKCKTNTVNNEKVDALPSETVSISSNHLPSSDSKSVLKPTHANSLTQLPIEHVDCEGLEMGSLEITFDPSDKLLIDEDEENDSEDKNSACQSQEAFNIPSIPSETQNKKLNPKGGSAYGMTPPHLFYGASSNSKLWPNSYYCGYPNAQYTENQLNINRDVNSSAAPFTSGTYPHKNLNVKGAQVVSKEKKDNQSAMMKNSQKNNRTHKIQYNENLMLWDKINFQGSVKYK